MVYILLLILLFPFFNFLVLLLSQNKVRKSSGWISSLNLGISFLLTVWVFSQVWGQPSWVLEVPWFSIGIQHRFMAGILLNNVSAFMLVVVTLVSLLVHLFSIEYMKDDPHYPRYFAYLGLFTFSMLGIVLADNLLFIYIFWELVGVSSYLLIGFWYHKQSAIRAARKAFLINRIGDVGFLIGILLVYVFFHTFQLSAIERGLHTTAVAHPVSHLQFTILGLCLFCGVLGKSAQFPLQVWLPDAMEGPTPVSALIHAATMVAAGVFLLARIFFLLNIDAFIIITFIGAITAFIGGVAALVQKDIKKVLAYSTISQLGYMVMGMGVGAYKAALFHLLTHAFFKACLFLGAGAIIHALHVAGKKTDHHFDAQNMYLMGGLGKKMPFTCATFIIASMSLAGLPFFSGFLSKDALLAASLAWGNLMGEGGSWLFYLPSALGFFVVLLTALYMTRVILLVFFGEFRLEKFYEKTNHTYSFIQEVSLLMKVPLGVLAFLSLWFVFSWNPFAGEHGWFMHNLQVPANLFLGEEIQRHLLEKQHFFHTIASIISVIMLILGGMIARFLFIRQRLDDAKMIVFSSKSLYRLVKESFYIDKVYQEYLKVLTFKLINLTVRFDQNGVDGTVNFIARFQVIIAFIIAWFDRVFVDGLVHLVVRLIGWTGRLTASGQAGKIQGYWMLTLSMLILVMLYLLWW